MDPTGARTAREYVSLLRKLKEHSRPTYRQLEQRAAERDEVPARSTLADVLRWDAPPRAEVVAALVRACGAGEDVPEWLAARERLAAGEDPATDGTDQEPKPLDGPADQEPEPPAGPPEPSDPRRGRTAMTVASASLGTVVLLTVGAVVPPPQDDGNENTKSTAPLRLRATRASVRRAHPSCA